MKKIFILIISLAAMLTVKAQWVDDPAVNTRIANCSNDAGEVYLSTNEATGDTYVQWMQFGSNSWSPTLQRVNSEGVPQWGEDGIHLGYHEFSSYSEGVAMAATTDGGVVSCFSVYEGYSYAVKLNADGTYAWGEEGVRLFDGLGFSRTEVIAGNDGGVWTLGFDYSRLFAQYVSADGTLNPNIIISAEGQNCMFGQLTLGNDNNVFVTYEKTSGGMYVEKEIAVAGYAVDGTQISPERVLMSGSGSFQSTYIHYAISDGMGGGYVYIWHPGIGEAFNVYVFHFNQNGAPTILNPQGAAVHSPDPQHYFGNAYATIDPTSHDIILAYEQTDASTQTESSIWINRINLDGDVLWGDGIRVIDNGNAPCHSIRVDAFPNGDGFMVSYMRQNSGWGESSIIEAKGYNNDGGLKWEKEMNNVNSWKVAADNTTGFHNGQDIMMWVNHDEGGLFGQNIGIDGDMGYIEPVLPCLAPENFAGEYVYNEEDQTFGALLTWDAPETQPLWYQLYITLPDETIIVAEIESTETEYFHELTTAATITYRLIAVYEYCESDYALTPDGEDHISVEITGIPENSEGEITSILRIFNMNGQCMEHNKLNELSSGVYIIQGLTNNGALVSRKIVVR
ncbi:MAG: T9SS type A sorting domain-containing protein [Bacteroidales bacterium]|nr:T9SS type A sorting domain-containing protein [Bacteroidales bacterium]